MANLKVLLEEKLSELKNDLISVTEEIELCRTVDQEEDVSIRRELLDKKDILTVQIEEIEEEIMEMNKNSKILNPDTITVEVGNIVKLNINGSKKDISIVSSTQADPSNGFVSADSPLGMALIGKKKGEKISIETPNGSQSYEILKIE